MERDSKERKGQATSSLKLCSYGSPLLLCFFFAKIIVSFSSLSFATRTLRRFSFASFGSPSLLLCFSSFLTHHHHGITPPQSPARRSHLSPSSRRSARAPSRSLNPLDTTPPPNPIPIHTTTTTNVLTRKRKKESVHTTPRLCCCCCVLVRGVSGCGACRCPSCRPAGASSAWGPSRCGKKARGGLFGLLFL